MIFTCPSGHKTFLGKAKEQECLPVIGSSEIRHCLTCNAERRFEWKEDAPNGAKKPTGMRNSKKDK